MTMTLKILIYLKIPSDISSIFGVNGCPRPLVQVIVGAGKPATALHCKIALVSATTDCLSDG